MQPPPISHLKKTVREKSGHDWLDRWRTSENGRLTYNFIPNKVPPHALKHTLSHKITQVLTGHCKLQILYANAVNLFRRFATTYGFVNWSARTESIQFLKACSMVGISYLPSPETLISNQHLFNALQQFLKNSSRLDF